MICPKCGGKTRVTDNSHNNQENETYRQRFCVDCSHVFYTAEIEVDDNPGFREAYASNHRKRNMGFCGIPEPTRGLNPSEMREAIDLYKKSKTDPVCERLARFESLGMGIDELRKAAELYKKAKEIMRDAEHD